MYLSTLCDKQVLRSCILVQMVERLMYVRRYESSLAMYLSQYMATLGFLLFYKKETWRHAELVPFTLRV